MNLSFVGADGKTKRITGYRQLEKMFLSLAISDLCSLTTMVGTCFFLTPVILTGDWDFEPVDIMYLTSAMPHLSFTRVSSCITAMITLERCLCITAPLKIKSMITPKRSVVITVSVFIIFFFSGTPVYVVNRLEMKFSPYRNKTLIGLVSSPERNNVELISFVINHFAIPFGAFLLIVVCTSILAFKLRSSTKWRKTTVTSTQLDRVSVRNQKAAKMVVMISTLFIVCFVPVSIIMLAAGFVPEMSINGKYLNLALMIGGLGYVMESVNSSMNIFIYYHMSSNYREILHVFMKKKI